MGSEGLWLGYQVGIWRNSESFGVVTGGREVNGSRIGCIEVYYVVGVSQWFGEVVLWASGQQVSSIGVHLSS